MFLPIFKIQLLETSPQKQKEQRQKQQDVSFLISFPFLYILNSLQSSPTAYIFQVCLLVKETAEIETGMAEKSSWYQANIRQKLGLVWRNRKKISQIIKDYFLLTVLPIYYFMFGADKKPFADVATAAEDDVADVANIVRV